MRKSNGMLKCNKNIFVSLDMMSNSFAISDEHGQ